MEFCIMGGEFEIIVKTPLQEVVETISNSTTSSQLFNKVTTSLKIVDPQYFILRYKNRQGYYKDLKWNDKVSSIKKKTSQKTLEVYLSIGVFPYDPTMVTDFTTKFLLYREIEVLLKTGELPCPQHLRETLDNLTEEENIDEYLGTIAGTLDDYGYFHFHMERRDGMPCRISINCRGIANASGADKYEMPFSDIQDVSIMRKKVKVKFTNREAQPLFLYARKEDDSKAMLRVFKRHREYWNQHKNIIDRSMEYV